MSLRTIRLYGPLGREFGRVHRLAVGSPAEAVRALCALFPRFEAAVIGNQYRVLNGGEVTAVDELHRPTGERSDVRIVPVLSGAKSGFFGIILGAALITAAFLTGGATLGASGLVFSGLGGQLAFGIGASLVLGGVSQMLTPTPKTGMDKNENKVVSSQFSGPVNTTAQGYPVPVGYGRLIVGSAVVSAGVSVQETAV